MVSLLQLDWSLMVVVLAIILFAGLVHGTLGLGFPMIATPLLAIFFDVRMAILITLLPTVAVNLASIWNSRNSLGHLRRFSPLIFFVLPGSLVGAYILAIADPAPFRLALAALIMLYLWTNLSGRLPGQWLVSNLMLAMALFGFTAGFAAGTTNVMVAILIVFFLSLEVPRLSMVPVLNACFLVGKISQITVLSLAGLVTATLLYETLPLAVAAVVTLLIGQRIRDKIAVGVYRRILHGLLVIIAIILMVQFFS
ncbi:MAG: sulfite exporter TauE/SafE family protein [Gammaproteobacteria bacterium]|nr:sulfite exporter TauE/SafE family protein [Gammaproteobacteria bacterium]